MLRTHLARTAAALSLGALLNACAGAPAADMSGTETMARPAAAAAPAPVAQGPALWVVRDPDSTIYLFGTFHALKDATQWRNAEIDAALKGSSELWLELADIGTPEATAATLPLIQRYGLDPTRPLSSKLTPAENKLLQDAAAKAGINPAQLEPLRPWLAGLQLVLVPIIKAGFDPNLGVDHLLAAAARAENKPIRGFETTEQQLRFFADLPLELEKQMLLQSLEDIERGPALVDRLSAAWSRGDLATLESELVNEMRADSPAFYKVVLADRNTAWAKAIKERLQGSGTSFVAVGAAHLVGPDSVQARLAEQGVKSERR